MKVLILGSGVIGTSLAYYLAKEGNQVTVIERQPGPALETSFANAGQISPGYAAPWAAPGIPWKAAKWMTKKDSPLFIKPSLDTQQYKWMWQLLRECNQRSYAINKERMVRLSEYSRDCFIQLREETGIAYEGRQLGTTELFRTQKQIDNAKKDIAVLEASNVPYEVLDQEGILKVEPALADVIDKFQGALRLPHDETGDCYLFTQKMYELAKELGADFQFNRIIDKLNVSRNTISGVWVDGTLMKADKYILCLGSYTAEMLEEIGLKAPIYPLKGNSITVPIQSADKSPVSTIMDEAHKVAITRFDQRIRVGGMAELVGYDWSLKSKRRSTLEMVFNDIFPQAGDVSEASFWAGLRPATPDGTPIIGETPIQNLYINSGHGTLGWTMSLGSARYLTDVIMERAPEISSEGLSINRYYK